MSLSRPQLKTNDDWLSLAEALARHHSMRSAPPTQPVEGGIQTPEFAYTDCRATAFGSARGHSINGRVILCLISTTELPSAPLEAVPAHAANDARQLGDSRKSGAFHRSHVHSKGWYSGTCYVEVPPAIDDTSDAGYLVIGEPPFSVKDAPPPLATIKPEVEG